MKKFKQIFLSSILVICATLISLSFAGCRQKIDNLDISKVLPDVTGSYKEITYPFDELKPLGFVKAYAVNNTTIVIKSQDVWSKPEESIYVYSAIKNGRYLNLVVEKTETSTLSDEAVKKVQNQVNTLKNSEVKFVLDNVVTGYNYPKATNTHYNVYKYVKANAKINKLDTFVTRTEEKVFKTENLDIFDGTPHIVTYESTVLSSYKLNTQTHVVVKTVPHNDSFAFYSPYCYVTIYAIFGESGDVVDYKFLELYCSPTETSFHTEQEFKIILGLDNFEENKTNSNIAEGTLTAGASWYALNSAKDYVNGNF